MRRVSIAIALLASASAASAREPLVHVPFVGCPSDGQTGPIPPPRPHQTPALPPRTAAKLAYYATDYASVLAPRGWHCIGLYGSSSQSVIVTPEHHKAQEFFHGVQIRGLAVQATNSVGGTSGRFSVAPVVARYFPQYRSFSRAVMEEMKEDDPRARPFPTHPYYTDVIKQLTANYLRFSTPAGRTREGTNSLLRPGKLSIEGVRKIVGSIEEPDLFAANVRLAANQSDLIEVILTDAAK